MLLTFEAELALPEILMPQVPEALLPSVAHNVFELVGNVYVCPEVPFNLKYQLGLSSVLLL